MTKSEAQNRFGRSVGVSSSVDGVSTFGFRASFVIGHSSFAICDKARTRRGTFELIPHRILPAQLRKPAEVGVAGNERGAVGNGQRCQMSVGGEVSECAGVAEQFL